MLELNQTSQFKKDLKRVLKKKLPVGELDEIILKLRKQEPLAERHRDHALTGNFAGFRECHVQPDWLLMYKVDKKRLILTASRMGTHADLLGK